MESDYVGEEFLHRPTGSHAMFTPDNRTANHSVQHDRILVSKYHSFVLVNLHMEPTITTAADRAPSYFYQLG